MRVVEVVRDARRRVVSGTCRLLSGAARCRLQRRCLCASDRVRVDRCRHHINIDEHEHDLDVHDDDVDLDDQHIDDDHNDGTDDDLDVHDHHLDDDYSSTIDDKHHHHDEHDDEHDDLDRARYYVHLDNDVVVHDNGAAYHYQHNIRGTVHVDNVRADDLDEYIHNDRAGDHDDHDDDRPGYYVDDLYTCATCDRARPCPDHDDIDIIIDDYVHYPAAHNYDHRRRYDIDNLIDAAIAAGIGGSHNDPAAGRSRQSRRRARRRIT